MSLVSRLFRRKRRYPGKVVTLRPLYKRDQEAILRWFEDIDLLELGFGILRDSPNFETVTSSYMENLVAHRDHFLAIEAPAGRFIGFVSLHVLDRHERIGRVGILVGERSAWGKGYGRDAMETALWFLFTEKGLNLVELDTVETNVRAQRCFEACGFALDPERTRLFGDQKVPRRIWYTISRTAFLRRQATSATRE